MRKATRTTIALALSALLALAGLPAQALAEAVEEVGAIEVVAETSGQDGAVPDVQAEEPAIEEPVLEEGLTSTEEPTSEEPVAEVPGGEIPAEEVPAAEEPAIGSADGIGAEDSAGLAANDAGQMADDLLKLGTQGSNDVIVTFSYDANHDESYRLLGLVNQARAQVGRGSLVWDADLENYALLRAAELVLHYDHTRPNGDDCLSGVPGWTTGAVCENIYRASSEVGASECNTSWTNSSGHYQNMIATDVGSFGAAIVYCQGMTYAVEVFRGGTSSKQYRANTGSRVSHPIHTWSTWVSRQYYRMSVYPSSMTLTPGQSQDAYLLVGEGGADWPSNAIVWSSSNTSVATVATGTGALTVTGKNPGTATITGTHTAIGYSVYLTVTVRNIEPTSVSLNRSSLSLYPGDGASLSGTVYPTNATNKTLTWSSSNTSVATVSSSGYVTAKAPGSATITARTTNGKTATCYVTVNRISISGATMAAVNDTAYTGSAIKPEPKVTLNGKALTKGSDFTYSYKNNTAVGTATVTVTGTGNYTGSVSRSFEIYLTKDVPVSVMWNDANNYWGVRPSFVRVMYDSEGKNARGEKFSVSSNYSVSFKDGWKQTFTGVRTPSADGTGLTFVVEAGSVDGYTSTVSGSFAKGYTVTYTTTQKIDISAGMGSGVTNRTYTGKAQTQSPSVTLNGVTLKSGTDFSVSYQDNVNAGLASVVCTGKGIYTYAKIIYFTITPAQISSATATKTADQTYTGSPLTPKPTLTFNGATLKEGTDYTLSYANNTNVGTATFTITGKGNFQGTATQTFKVVKAANGLVASAQETTQTITYSPSVQELPSNVVVEGAHGAVSFENASEGAAEAFEVDEETGALTLPKPTNAGTYAVVVRVSAAGDKNHKAAEQDVAFEVKVAKADNPMTAKATKASVAVTYDPSVPTITAKNVGTSGKVGTLSYANASTTEATKGFEVDPSTGEVTLPKATRAATYTVKVKVTAAGNKNYKAGSKTVSYKIVVKKAANPITAMPVTRTASFDTLKTKAVTVSKPLTVSGSIGTKTYARAQNSNYFTVDEATGKVTIKKGTPKGTYTLKVKVTAAGGPNYEPGSKTVTSKITVK